MALRHINIIDDDKFDNLMKYVVSLPMEKFSPFMGGQVYTLTGKEVFVGQAWEVHKWLGSHSFEEFKNYVIEVSSIEGHLTAGQFFVLTGLWTGFSIPEPAIETKNLSKEDLESTLPLVEAEPLISPGVKNMKFGYLRHGEVASAVVHPSHYNQGKFEVIDVIEDWKLGFCLGNVVKYVARAEHKGNTLEDLKKALWYLNREIQNLEKEK